MRAAPPIRIRVDYSRGVEETDVVPLGPGAPGLVRYLGGDHRDRLTPPIR